MPTPEPPARVVARAAKARAALLANGGRRLEIKLDAETSARLDAHAARLGLSVTAVVRLALMRWK